MHRFLFLGMAFAALSLTLVSPLVAQGPKKSKTLYTLVEVDGSSHQIVESKSLAGLKAQIAAEYKKSLADWTTAKKLAKKEKRAFKTPKPKKGKLKVLKKGFKSREEADKHLAKILAKKKKK